MKMRHFYIIGFGALMLFDTLTQVAFKLASNNAGEFMMNPQWLLSMFHHPWIYVAVAGYLGSFVAWMTLLKHAPVGPSFAASHLEVVAVLAISVLYFGEQLKITQVAGALCIVLGIVFLSMSESKQAHET